MYYRLVSTPAGFGVFGGVGMGIASGVRFWLGEKSVVAGLLAAAIGGIAFGVIFALAARRMLEPFAGLTSTERARVMRTVQKGLPTTDRRLAPTVVVYAATLRQQNERFDTFLRSPKYGALLGFQVILVIITTLLQAWGSLALFATILVAGVLSPFSLRSRRERFTRAEQSARALLDQG